jgi:hypothetical protein
MMLPRTGLIHRCNRVAVFKKRVESGGESIHRTGFSREDVRTFAESPLPESRPPGYGRSYEIRIRVSCRTGFSREDVRTFAEFPLPESRPPGYGRSYEIKPLDLSAAQILICNARADDR